MISKRFLSIILAMLLLMASSLPCAQVNAQKQTDNRRYTFSNIKAQHIISADVKLLGDGDGYHAKLVLVTPTSGFSFGIQFDKGASAPYTGRAMLIAENIHSNDEGGQVYDRPGNIEVHLGKTYNLMLSLDSHGNINTYFNGRIIGTYHNSKLAGKKVRPRVEGSAKHNGDVVDVDFSHIRIKDDPIDEVYAFWPYEIDTAKRINSKIINNTHVRIYGKLTDLKEGEDWDSAYEAVSGIVQFNFE